MKPSILVFVGGFFFRGGGVFGVFMCFIWGGGVFFSVEGCIFFYDIPSAIVTRI